MHRRRRHRHSHPVRSCRPVVPIPSGWPPPETGAPVRPNENTVPQAGCIQTAFVEYQRRLVSGMMRSLLVTLMDTCRTHWRKSGVAGCPSPGEPTLGRSRKEAPHVVCPQALPA